jgi:membrane protease subunit (stomatin/prohibitin family)
MNTLLKWGVGVAALGVTAYVVGRAWKKSQQKNNNVGFAGAAGPGSRLAAISSAARGGAPQYACNCSCGAKVWLKDGQTAKDCPELCRDRCN